MTEVKLLWHMNIQCGHVIEARRPDITPLSILLFQGIRELVKRRIRKLKSVRNGEFARMWNVRTVQVKSIVVGSLGSVTKNLDKWLEKVSYLCAYWLSKVIGKKVTHLLYIDDLKAFA